MNDQDYIEALTEALGEIELEARLGLNALEMIVPEGNADYEMTDNAWHSLKAIETLAIDAQNL